MPGRRHILKILAIIALIGLVLVVVVGCQKGQTQSINDQATNNQNGQQMQVAGPRVLYFSSEY
ncbi:MAG: hypothetical protein IBX64_00985 [Actinobacteria bacterium]|nr:hypothetical protein [Actinomycetota bacterium]